MHSDFVTKGTSQRYKDGDDMIYRFSYVPKTQSFDTTAFNTTHTLDVAGEQKQLNKAHVDNLCQELVTEMRLGKRGKFYQPETGDYIQTLVVYLLTWEVIAFALWHFVWKDYYWLFGIPVIFVLLAIVSIMDEVKEKRNGSYMKPLNKLNKFEGRLGGRVSIKLDDHFDFIEFKVINMGEDVAAPEIRPYQPNIAGLTNQNASGV